MLPANKTLRSDYIFRRKRERQVFIKQRLQRFLWLSRLNCKYGVDWYKYLHLPEVQSLIIEARQYLIYSAATDDYSIWVTLYSNFYKTWLKPLN